MPNRDFIDLMLENLFILDRLSDRIKTEHGLVSDYTPQQIATILRLHLGGPALLKDIARRECTTAPNLCAAFRKLESGGLVNRRIDEKDRRNTWYSVTRRGADLARRAMEKIRGGIAALFDGMTPADEKTVIDAITTINGVLKKMEIKNA
jgi:DNA-binding MarR family transcriptional regulator